ncbi:MAG: hypothetical protein CMJ83_10480 [Planctomycetes bacterium]|nr:hypothetical protein [Planctomycetota bacterium]
MAEKSSSDGGGERRSRARRGRGRGRSGDRSKAPSSSSPDDSSTADDGTRFDPDGGALEAADAEGGGGGDSARRSRRRRNRPAPGGSEVEELGASTGIDVLDIPSDRRPRRAGALEPGLTLKDLLPFLRPPKTVLILGASTGGGHNRTAAALHEAFKSVDRNLIVRQHDCLDLLGPDQNPQDVRLKLEGMARSPALFGETFETVEGPTGAETVDGLGQLLTELFGEKMDQMVLDKRPDQIVCTHWLPLVHLQALKDAERLNAGVCAVISDPDLHEHWVSEVVSHYLVTDDGLKARLQRAGVDPSTVTVTGTPVSPAFADGVDKEFVLRDLGLRGSAPTILLRPGGIGATERIVEVVKSLLELASINLLVVAGKNERLREELGDLEVPQGCALKAFGFVQNIHELMGVSDLLISRASPHTMAEACAAGLPALLLRPSPGIEERMADHLMRSGCVRKAYGERDLEFLVAELVKNRRYLREMQEAAGKHRRSDAAHLAVDRLTRIVN